LALAGLGARVAVNYVSNQKAALELVAMIRAEGGHAEAFPGNVAIRTEAEALVRETMGVYERLDILINNAGWSQLVPHERLDLLTDEIVDRTLDTNVKGPLHCIRAATPHLQKANPGRVVNISSVAAINGLGSSVIYCASKAALITLGRSLARALSPNIRVNSVLPGFVDTGFAYPLHGDMAAQTAQRNHIGRILEPKDIAAAVIYLVTDGQAMTGEEIVVDGGLCRLSPRST
jgi:3-oxoacyl-[acyl-carrier protein] reductase